MRTTIASLAVAGMTAAASAQTNAMIISEFNSNRAIIVQNGQLVRSITLNSNDENAMAVYDTDDIRFVGIDPGDLGGKYNEFGAYLGVSYDNDGAGAAGFFDGATDGTFNFAIANNASPSNVFIGDARWDGMVALFQPTRRSSGIAYDTRTDTLWTSVTDGDLTYYQQYTLNGNILREYPVTVPPGVSGYGIAYDDGSDTFFVTAWSGGGFDLYQLDRNGNVIAAIDVPGVTGAWMGIEPFYYLCRTDCDGNGVVNTADVGCLISRFFADQANGTLLADYDGNGVVNAADIGAFLSDFFDTLGPCRPE